MTYDLDSSSSTQDMMIRLLLLHILRAFWVDTRHHQITVCYFHWAEKTVFFTEISRGPPQRPKSSFKKLA
jgi:hypothetical protein